jgi:hypothetical protein
MSGDATRKKKKVLANSNTKSSLIMPITWDAILTTARRIVRTIGIDPTDGVLFMKDNDNRYRESVEDEVPLMDMFEKTSSTNDAIAKTPMRRSYPRGFTRTSTALLINYP